MNECLDTLGLLLLLLLPLFCTLALFVLSAEEDFLFSSVCFSHFYLVFSFFN